TMRPGPRQAKEGVGRRCWFKGFLTRKARGGEPPWRRRQPVRSRLRRAQGRAVRGAGAVVADRGAGARRCRNRGEARSGSGEQSRRKDGTTRKINTSSVMHNPTGCPKQFRMVVLNG